MKERIEVSIRRQDPSDERGPEFRTYGVSADRDMTVLEVLREIYFRLDPTLAFRDYRCGRRLCRSCEVKVDGKVVRGCATLLHPGEAYRLEPARPEALIRDLVFEFPAGPGPEGER